MPRKLEHALAGKKIGVFGKGGSGKSTLTVFLAKALRRMDYNVVVLDADSTNVCLAAALGLDSPPAPLIDYFGGMISIGGFVTCPVDDPSRLARTEVQLSQFPGKYIARTTEGICLLEIDNRGKRAPGLGFDGSTSRIARDLKLRAAHEDPVILVDFKAGIEDVTRVVITGLHWAIVTVNPTLSSLEVAVDMREMVEKMKAGIPLATRHLDNSALVDLTCGLYRKALIRGVFAVLTNTPDPETERYLWDRFFGSGMEPIGVIHSDSSISTAWLHGTPLGSRKAQAEARNIVQSLSIAESNWSAGKAEESRS